MGCEGVCGTLCANIIAKEADCIIAVGTKLNDFVTSSKSAFQSENVKMVSINVNLKDSLKMNSVSVLADAKEGILELSKELEKINYMSSYENEIEDAKTLWENEIEKLSKIELEQGLSQTRVIIELNKFLGEKDVIVSASGSMPSDLERLWRPKKKGTYHLEYGFSCMGYEIPAAMGVKLAEPDVEVYALIGDGVFSMAHSELITSIQEKKKINIILFDNNGHQCIHNLQRSQGIDSFATEFRFRKNQLLVGEYIPLNFSKIAEGYGAKSYTVTNLKEFREALVDSKKQLTSTLIDVKVLPNTMTDGYESFWRVGTAQVAENEKVEKAAEVIKDRVKIIRKY